MKVVFSAADSSSMRGAGRMRATVVQNRGGGCVRDGEVGPQGEAVPYVNS